MQARNVIMIGRLTTIALACLVGVPPVGGQTPGKGPDPRKPASAATRPLLRTPHGDPDLEGVWNFATATPMERPAELAGRELLTDQEAAEFEHEIRENASADRRE